MQMHVENSEHLRDVLGVVTLAYVEPTRLRPPVPVWPALLTVGKTAPLRADDTIVVKDGRRRTADASGLRKGVWRGLYQLGVNEAPRRRNGPIPLEGGHDEHRLAVRGVLRPSLELQSIEVETHFPTAVP